MSIPPLGDMASAAPLDVQTTRTVPGGSSFAVLIKVGVKSLVKRNGAMLFVPICNSYPCFVLLP